MHTMAHTHRLNIAITGIFYEAVAPPRETSSKIYLETDKTLRDCVMKEQSLKL